MIEKTVQMEHGAVSFTDIPDEISRPEPTEVEMLSAALSDVTQRCAEMQEEMRIQEVLHEKVIEGMVAKQDGDTGGKLFEAILGAIAHMDCRRDEAAYRTLKSMVEEHGEEFGHREVDPMSLEALQGIQF